MEPETMQGEEMTPEDAKASLGLATRLGDQFLMSQAPQEPMEDLQTPETASGQEETPEPEETQEDETDEPEEEISEVDTSGIVKSIEDLEMIHEKEVAALRSEIKEDQMKKEHEAKIAVLEAKHKKDLEDVKRQLKDILNE